jgi:hypothetical protein
VLSAQRPRRRIYFQNLGRRWLTADGSIRLRCPARAYLDYPSVGRNRFGQLRIIWVSPLEIPLTQLVSPGRPKLLGNFTLSVENTNTMELVIGDVVLWAQHTVGARVILIVLYLNLAWMWLLYL